MSDGGERDDEELVSGEPATGSPTAPLANPAPGDMPVDPPLTPGRLLPTEDTQ